MCMAASSILLVIIVLIYGITYGNRVPENLLVMQIRTDIPGVMGPRQGLQHTRVALGLDMKAHDHAVLPAVLPTVPAESAGMTDAGGVAEHVTPVKHVMLPEDVILPAVVRGLIPIRLPAETRLTDVIFYKKNRPTLARVPGAARGRPSVWQKLVYVHGRQKPGGTRE